MKHRHPLYQAKEQMIVPPIPKDVMTAAEVATYLGVHRITVHRLVRKGILQSFFVGRLRRFSRADVEAATAAHPDMLVRCLNRNPVSPFDGPK